VKLVSTVWYCNLNKSIRQFICFIEKINDNTLDNTDIDPATVCAIGEYYYYNYLYFIGGCINVTIGDIQTIKSTHMN